MACSLDGSLLASKPDGLLMSASVQTPPASLADAFSATAARRNGATALLFDDALYSFGQVGQRAAEIAGALVQRGVHAGDRVAVGLPNSPELVAVVLGVLHAGAVLVPLNPAYTADELTYIVADAGARVAIVHSEHATLLMDAPLPDLSLILDATESLTGPARDVVRREAYRFIDKVLKHEPVKEVP